MTFGLKTLKKQIKGACLFEEDGRYLSCFHFTNEQFDYFKAADRGWNMRSHFSCGVRMEFKTDATKLSFGCRIGYAWSDDCTLDVYCDGMAVAVKHFPGDGKYKVEFDLPAKEKLLTVYFPADCRFEIRDVTINGSYKTTKETGKKLLILGDSLSQGYGTLMAGATYVNTVQRRTGYSILNQAIGGYPYKAESLIPISGFDPDLVLVMLGTNYYNSPKYDYEKEVSCFYEQLHAVYGDRPILSVTPFWRTTDDFDPERNAWCIEVIKSECSKYANITLLEGYKILPHIPDIYRDGCHPNAYGASLLADALVPALKNLK